MSVIMGVFGCIYFTLLCKSLVCIWLFLPSICSLIQRRRLKLLLNRVELLGNQYKKLNISHFSFRRSNCNWNIYVRDFLSGCTAPYLSIWCQNMSHFYNIYKPVFVKYPCSHILHIHIHVANYWLLQHIYISMVVSLGCLLLSKTRIIWMFVHGSLVQSFSIKLHHHAFRWHSGSVIKPIWLHEEDS